MLHPATTLQAVSATIGIGVFATRRIPKGSATWLLDLLDQVLTPAAVDRLPPACRA